MTGWDRVVIGFNLVATMTVLLLCVVMGVRFSVFG